MRTYTVEVTWRVSEYAHLIVKAETPEAAMAKALECSESGLPVKSNRAEDRTATSRSSRIRNTTTRAIGRNRVTGIWQGEEAYPNNAVTLPLPPTPRKSSKRRSRRCVGSRRVPERRNSAAFRHKASRGDS
jgi:hypothetical protein